MTAEEQWRYAMYYAASRASWRAVADRGGRPDFTRRQCLVKARYCEARIVDLAIKIEIDLRRIADAPVPNFSE